MPELQPIDMPNTDMPDTESQEFYEGAYSRMMRTMAAVAVLATVAADLRFGWRVAGGVLTGCALGAVNFLWLKRAINTFAGRIAEKGAEGAKTVRGSASRFVLRYGFIGAIAYVIFKSSFVSLGGVLAGLFLPVAAILVEAVYETYIALRRGL